MARWKELPDSLDQRERQLVVQLRRLKDRSGLSLAALAAKTTYSSSSWERWLNGKKPVPRGAVTELARVCGTEPTRLLVLHEVAEGAAAGPGAETGAEPCAEPDAGPTVTPGSGSAVEPRTTKTTAGPSIMPPARPTARVTTRPTDRPSARGPRPRPRLVLGAAAALLVAFGAGMITGLSWQGDGSGGQQPAPTADAYRRGQAYDCDISRKDGGLYAGHSVSRDVLLDLNSIGWDVVEAQCLLRRHGFDPGGTDGVYGEQTKRAATAFQEKREIGVDGIVGPDTWRELRK
ncbi:helix-turn-helix domain-containing protein [Streptomyces sporangiiformans]|uniref:Helix-turn-helix domain-containing protein n=1 Tax=Streptomyces sporangiiformans TaxID=2315329 RepID=A0A505DM57_9ACTN|nr:helix-turn-helix domain-containing protein [Streptomyces sporangiiformans]TPQ21826.1 helix-turn-helix domain-containing protein [Streptomyces sporangiiformans]